MKVRKWILMLVLSEATMFQPSFGSGGDRAGIEPGTPAEESHASLIDSAHQDGHSASISIDKIHGIVQAVFDRLTGTGARDVDWAALDPAKARLLGTLDEGIFDLRQIAALSREVNRLETAFRGEAIMWDFHNKLGGGQPGSENVADLAQHSLENAEQGSVFVAKSKTILEKLVIQLQLARNLFEFEDSCLHQIELLEGSLAEFDEQAYFSIEIEQERIDFLASLLTDSPELPHKARHTVSELYTQEVALFSKAWVVHRLQRAQKVALKK